MFLYTLRLREILRHTVVLFSMLQAIKRVLPLLCLLLFANNLHAQAERWRVSAFVGPSVATGTFAKKRLNEDDAAFAKTGICASISLNYSLHPRYGLATLLRLQKNGVDTKAMETMSTNGMSSFPYHVSIKSESWKMAIVMMGAYYLLPVNDKFSFHFTAMAGAVKTAVPTLTQLVYEYVTGYTNGVMEQDTTYTMVTKSSDPLRWTFAYLGGIGANYNIGKNVFVVASVDYAAAKPTIDRLAQPVTVFIATPRGIVTTYTGTIVPTGAPTYRQPLTTLSVSFGAGIAF